MTSLLQRQCGKEREASIPNLWKGLQRIDPSREVDRPATKSKMFLNMALQLRVKRGRNGFVCGRVIRALRRLSDESGKHCRQSMAHAQAPRIDKDHI